jgi:hypothetical protein
MAFSGLAVVGVIALLLLGLGVISPILGAVVAIVAILPLVLMLIGRTFRHVGVGANAGTTGPAVPSTREASYEPVADPTERG